MQWRILIEGDNVIFGVVCWRELFPNRRMIPSKSQDWFQVPVCRAFRETRPYVQEVRDRFGCQVTVELEDPNLTMTVLNQIDISIQPTRQTANSDNRSRVLHHRARKIGRWRHLEGALLDKPPVSLQNLPYTMGSHPHRDSAHSELPSHFVGFEPVDHVSFEYLPTFRFHFSLSSSERHGNQFVFED